MPTTTKLDMKRQLKGLYAPPAHPVLVDVPELRYLMVDGQVPEGAKEPGDDPAFAAAIGALYGISYTLKFQGKAAGRDHVVMPLEGLFWTGPDGRLVTDGPSMSWTLMIAQPDWVTDADIATARAKLVARHRLPADVAVRLETLREERAAQVLHIGPYTAEPPTIEKLHAFIDELGLVAAEKHHEIYLSDPNRTAPERLRTIIRQPIRSASGPSG
jgi:hypothetical protein